MRWGATVSSREERIARNERAARDLIDSIERASTDRGTSAGSVHIRILCECGRVQCDRVLAVTIAEYEGVRAHPRRLAVARGHVMARVERVVARTNRYVVVEKHDGAPVEIGLADDPPD
jgi:hypothetical protein